jgi:hypothetical protein
MSSRARRVRRSGLDWPALLSDGPKGLLRLIVIPKEDRLARSVLLWQHVEALPAKYDVTVRTVVQPPHREDSPVRTFARTVMAGGGGVGHVLEIEFRSASRSGR